MTGGKISWSFAVLGVIVSGAIGNDSFWCTLNQQVFVVSVVGDKGGHCFSFRSEVEGDESFYLILSLLTVAAALLRIELFGKNLKSGFGWLTNSDICVSFLFDKGSVVDGAASCK